MPRPMMKKFTLLLTAEQKGWLRRRRKVVFLFFSTTLFRPNERLPFPSFPPFSTFKFFYTYASAGPAFHEKKILSFSVCFFSFREITSFLLLLHSSTGRWVVGLSVDPFYCHSALPSLPRSFFSHLVRYHTHDHT